MADLDRKVLDVFTGRVVRKDLVRRVKVGAIYQFTYWNTC